MQPDNDKPEELKVKTVSPIRVYKTDETMTLPEALKKVIEGKKITKLEWDNASEYIYLDAEKLLRIHRDNKDHQWIINDGDLLGTDWIVLLS